MRQNSWVCVYPNVKMLKRSAAACSRGSGRRDRCPADSASIEALSALSAGVVVSLPKSKCAIEVTWYARWRWLELYKWLNLCTPPAR